jgi:hypothetical protein
MAHKTKAASNKQSAKFDRMRKHAVKKLKKQVRKS